MTVEQLRKLLENVNPDLEVYVWDAFSEMYQEANFAGCEDLYKLEDGEMVYDEDDEPIMFEAFIVCD